jgi:hypothetical protein
MIQWIIDNKEWLFSGAGAVVLAFIFGLIKIKRKQNQKIETLAARPNLNVSPDLKSRTKILFIDDDPKFKVVTILKKSGWINTKSVKDIYNYDDPIVKETHIFFVDVQGVGKALDCKDEGLGLALNLKKKYPDKKVVIYSAETKGDRFHEGLRKADTFLPKNAEPYEFQEIVGQYSKEIFSI